MKQAHPYLNFPGHTEEAFTFYKSVFGGEFAMLVRFRDFDMPAGDTNSDKIAHIALPVGQTMLMGTDALESHGRTLVAGNNFSINVQTESVEEAERVFAALADGGSVTMPLAQTQWAERYGMCVDRYGIQWMVNYEGSVQYRR